MITWMEFNGVGTIEPTAEAEQGWMDLVLQLAEKNR